jgi:hypothetical protein
VRDKAFKTSFATITTSIGLISAFTSVIFAIKYFHSEDVNGKQPKVLTVQIGGRVIDAVSKAGRSAAQVLIDGDIVGGPTATYADAEGVFTLPFSIRADSPLQVWLISTSLGYNSHRQKLDLHQPQGFSIEPVTPIPSPPQSPPITQVCIEPALKRSGFSLRLPCPEG